MDREAHVQNVEKQVARPSENAERHTALHQAAYSNDHQQTSLAKGSHSAEQHLPQAKADEKGITFGGACHAPGATERPSSTPGPAKPGSDHGGAQPGRDHGAGKIGADHGMANKRHGDMNNSNITPEQVQKPPVKELAPSAPGPGVPDHKDVGSSKAVAPSGRYNEVGLITKPNSSLG